jgi:hypothetical protein
MIKLTKLLVLLLATTCAANSAAVTVTYTATGSPGAWDLDFTVANNMTLWPSQDLYLFGVLLSGPGITGSPTGYDPTLHPTWTNFFSGGSSNFYNNVWADETDLDHLLPGSSLSGFVVHVTDLVVPPSVQWFAWSVTNTFDPADLYTGADAFNIDPDFLTAGFEGIADAPVAAAAVPEPWSIGLVMIGLTACTYLRQRRR